MSWLATILIPLAFAPGDGPGERIDEPRRPAAVEQEEEQPPPNLQAALELETRARKPTDPRAEGDAAVGEVFVSPAVDGRLMPDDWRLHLHYAPAFTFTSVDPLDDPFILHRGAASVRWSNDYWEFQLSEWAMIGDQNFAVPEGIQIGGQYQLDFLPDANLVRLPFVSSSTVLGGAWKPTERQEYRLLLDYIIYGGRGEAAQDVVPMQTGPRVVAQGLWDMSRIDVFSTALRGTRLDFSNGRAYSIGEFEAAWARLLGRTTELRGGLGLYGAVNESPLQNDEFGSLVLPLGSLLLTRAVGFGQTRGELVAGFQERPFINQLDATLEPRMVGEIGFEWEWRRHFYGEALIEHAWAFDAKLRHDGRILGMGLVLGIEPTRGLRVEAGARGYEQTYLPEADGAAFVGTRWDVFATLITEIPVVR